MRPSRADLRDDRARRLTARMSSAPLARRGAVMIERPLALLTIGLSVSAGCGGDPSGSTEIGGAGGSSTSGTGAGGSEASTCPDTPNASGPVVDMEWPAPSNVGHDVLPG